MSRTSTNPSVYEIVTNRIVQLLDDGVVPWRKTWSSPSDYPLSLNTGAHYRGINNILLGSAPFTNPYWATFKQITARKGQVKRGSQGWPVFFWKVYDKKKKDANGKEITKRLFVARYYTVFNLEQCENIETPEPPKSRPEGSTTIIGSAQQLVDGYISPTGAGPSLIEGTTPCYRMQHDAVEIPKARHFDNDDEYYSTLFHELVHSTGHPDRLDRLSPGSQPSLESYSYEELVAEMGASFLCGKAGITTTWENSASYIAGWRKVFTEDTRIVVQAAQAATKAVDLIAPAQED